MKSSSGRRPGHIRGRPLRAATLTWLVSLPLALGMASFSMAAEGSAPSNSATAVAGPSTQAPQAPTPANAPTPSAAPTVQPIPSPTAALPALNFRLAQLQNQAQTTSDDGRLAGMNAEAAVIQSQAESATAVLSGKVTLIDAAVRKATPSKRKLTPAEKRIIASLQVQRAPLAAELAQANATAAMAEHTFSQIAQRRREGFAARVFQRSASPASPDFWTSLAASSDSDFGRLATIAQEAMAAALMAPQPKGLAGLVMGLTIAGVVVLPVRRRLGHLGDRAREGFAGAVAAAWKAFVNTSAVTLAAEVFRLSARWGGVLTEPMDPMAGAVVAAIAWGAAILALGGAVEAAYHKSQEPSRLHAAGRARLWLWAAALVTGTGFVLQEINYLVGASVPVSLATDCALSLAYAGVAALMLFSLERARGVFGPPSAEEQRPSAPGWTLVSLGLIGAILATVGAVLAGYIPLAALISSQIFWIGMITASAALLLRLLDEGSSVLFGTKARATLVLAAMFGVRPATVAQAGLILSAALQLLIVIFAFLLAITPFGANGDQLLAHIGSVGASIHIGQVQISPASIAAGIGVFAVGMGLAHLVRNWVVRRYLPVTGWDSGVRDSVSTGVGYLGVALTCLCAFAAMGLGFQQVALIASALSVGIGFGLQQVVQNFVSGIILLIERPVKVGDWINVGGVEGDVRRIRVRATEIQTFDRSTVIVPNSNLITQNVENKTLGTPRRRVQVMFAIAKPTDARKARDLILSSAKGRADILEDPAPSVLVGSIAAAGAVAFNCYFYVADPRSADQVRSEAYLDILDVLQRNEVVLS